MAWAAWSCAEAQSRAQLLGGRRGVEILVADRRNVASGPLDEQGHRAGPGLLDHARGKAGKIGTDAAARRAAIGVTGEIVDQCQRLAGQRVHAEQADLRVQGPRSGHVGVLRQRRSAADRPVRAVFHAEPAVDRNAVFPPDADPDASRDQVLAGLFDRFDDPRNHVPGHRVERVVIVRGVHQNARRIDAQFLLHAAADVRHQRLGHHHQVERDNHRLVPAVLQHQGLSHQRIADGIGRLIGRDVDRGHARAERSRRLGRGDCR